MPRTTLRLRALLVLGGLFLTVLPLGPAAIANAAPTVPVATNPLGCDPLDPAMCLFPFPNDLYTVADPTTDTGRRVNFNIAAMPRNGTEVTEGGEGKPADPTEWNRNDGFSPGSMVMTYVPEIDLHATWGTQDRPHSTVGPNEIGYFDHRDHIADIGLFERPDAPMVLINTETGQRHPFWSELDTHPEAVAAGEQALILRPAVNFDEGVRYVVGLRNLKRTDGSVIPARPEFAAYRSGAGADAARQAHFDSDIFPVLEANGIARDGLYLAWDFTVASERNLAERILHIRDDAFGRILGDTDLADRIVQGESPDFTVDSTEARTDSWTDSRGVSHTQQIRRVEGRVTVPNYLDRIQQTEGHVQGNQLPYDAPAPGSRFLDLDLDGLPDQNPAESTVNVPFTCDVVLSQDGAPVAAGERAAVLYGHGLLGDRSQLGDLKSPRRDGPFYGCAADWWGMSTPDLPTVAATLGDISNFPSLPDRAQQGFLNFMFLGRAAVHPDGFATNPAFQADGVPVIKTADESGTPLYYDGNSQGGIMGGSLVAVSPDIKRGILGVLGMNYSTLLNRSVDWEGEYAVVYNTTYQDPLERQLGFALLQMLWDRGEANGFAHHMTDDPYANTPSHEVMLQAAFSDHQVTNHAAEVEARTIGAPLMPGLEAGRHWAADPFIDTATYPYQGSALIYWDSGNATPPNGNIPASHGSDPHSHPRSEPAASWQEAQFLLTGWMEDVCEGGPYLTDDHPANDGARSCHAPDRAPGTPPVVSAAPTEIAFTDSTSSSGQYSDASTFAARLTSDSGPVEGAEVSFDLGDLYSSRSLTAITNADGVATVTTTLTERPSDYQLTARYLGSDALQSSSAGRLFQVLREDSALTLTSGGKTQRRLLTARLFDADSSEGLAARPVEFFADGGALGNSVTDASGYARYTLDAKWTGGHHSFQVRFAGDDYYLPGSANLNT
jgi:hypothetical protein